MFSIWTSGKGGRHCRKRRKPGFQHFLLFPQCFQKGFDLGVVKSRDCEVNSLQNNKILDWSKLKALADEKNNWDSKMEICCGNGRKQCGKRRKCWLAAFSPFPTICIGGFFLRGHQVGIVW